MCSQLDRHDWIVLSSVLHSRQHNQIYNKRTWTQNTASPLVYNNMRWLGDSSHRRQGCQAWTAVGLLSRYPPIRWTDIVSLAEQNYNRQSYGLRQTNNVTFEWLKLISSIANLSIDNILKKYRLSLALSVSQSARMSKIRSDGLTRSGTWCVIAVRIWQQWASKG